MLCLLGPEAAAAEFCFLGRADRRGPYFGAVFGFSICKNFLGRQKPRGCARRRSKQTAVSVQ